jgi:hypothetical protein
MFKNKRSMLPDVIDEFMIKTGERNESIFYSFYVFFNKLSVGVAVGLSTLVLEYKIFKFYFSFISTASCEFILKLMSNNKIFGLQRLLRNLLYTTDKRWLYIKNACRTRSHCATLDWSSILVEASY